jgi:hypothetical protein
MPVVLGTWETEAKDHEFQASLGNIARPLSQKKERGGRGGWEKGGIRKGS